MITRKHFLQSLMIGVVVTGAAFLFLEGIIGFNSWLKTLGLSFFQSVFVNICLMASIGCILKGSIGGWRI